MSNHWPNTPNKCNWHWSQRMNQQMFKWLSQGLAWLCAVSVSANNSLDCAVSDWAKVWLNCVQSVSEPMTGLTVQSVAEPRPGLTVCSQWLSQGLCSQWLSQGLAWLCAVSDWAKAWLDCVQSDKDWLNWEQSVMAWQCTVGSKFKAKLNWVLLAFEAQVPHLEQEVLIKLQFDIILN